MQLITRVFSIALLLILSEGGRVSILLLLSRHFSLRHFLIGITIMISTESVSPVNVNKLYFYKSKSSTNEDCPML
jgi:hypothetical protein